MLDLQLRKDNSSNEINPLIGPNKSEAETSGAGASASALVKKNFDGVMSNCELPTY